MSGIKDPNLTQFYASLHHRGSGITALSRKILCGRSHLSQVLSGKRKGTVTWRKLIKVKALTTHELQLLGKVPASPVVDDVPRGTNSHMEHSTQGASSWLATG
jgi:hypothetical protein